MLQGLRILEIEGIGPTPFAGMLLADLGADVVVIHRKGGSLTPGVPPQAVIDRGKRSIALDLKDPNDLALFKSMTTKADAVIEGFRPGVLERLGIGPEVLQQKNPRLVIGRMTGWGQDGPMAQTAGHDLNYLSLSGALWYASEAGDCPFTPPTMVGDVGGGALYLVIGLLAALMKAKTSGHGEVVDAAIVDGSAHMMGLLMMLRQSGFSGQERGVQLLDGSHFGRCYRTRDGKWVAVQCLEPKFYARFLELMHLGDAPEFQNQFAKKNWPALTQRLHEIFATKDRSDWEQIFLNDEACVTPVLSPDESATHPALKSRAIWNSDTGFLQAAPAPRFSNQTDWMPPPIPKRDQHRHEILTEFSIGTK